MDFSFNISGYDFSFRQWTDGSPKWCNLDIKRESVDQYFTIQLKPKEFKQIVKTLVIIAENIEADE